MIDNKRLVSVVICFLNPGAWLAEAIESVIHQTYTNWQLILVDDGSKEQDSNLAKSYCALYPRKIIYVEHLNHINRGLPVSRNVGAAHAKGEYLAFLDADDYWLPEKLERQLSVFDEHPEIEMLCEASIFWYTWADVNNENYIQQIGAENGIYHPPQLMHKLYPLGDGAPPCPSGIIMKMQTFLSIGGFQENFNGIYQLYEDQAFLSKAYANAVVYISGEANNMYRKRADSMSSAASDEETYKTVRLFYLEWLKNYFFNSKNINPQIKNLIKKFSDKI